MADARSASADAAPGTLDPTARFARSGQSRVWPGLRRALGLAFFLAVAALLALQARRIDWLQVAGALRALPMASVWRAALLAAASFALYSGFELLGRAYTRHGLGVWPVVRTAFVSYAFNLNLGSLVGGVATRLRLYSRLGLPLPTITRVLAISLLTNWMGYFALAGLLFMALPPELPGDWGIRAAQLRLAGAGLLLVALAYGAACVAWPRRMLAWRGRRLELPSARMAALQLAMGAANWLLMAGILVVLLQQQVPFSLVASALLVAAVAGVVTHIPANLGVLEAIFVAMLGHRMAAPDVLAALVAYRVVYYLAPLALAAALYGGLEWQGRAGVKA
jgi:glycosyltransferase 2 family protein